MDFSKFKDPDAAADKATFTAKIETSVYEEYRQVKKEHKDVGCTPYLIHDIVEAMIKELTQAMKDEIKKQQ